ncbi:hypothetical protein BH09ACT9_BH09ACT9_00740 [soil metagenome]
MSFNAGAIVFQVLMQGAAVFQKDGSATEQTTRKLGDAAEASAVKVTKAGTSVDGLGKATKGAKAPVDGATASTSKLAAEAEKAGKTAKSLGDDVDGLGKKTKSAKAPLDETAQAEDKLGKNADAAAAKAKKLAAEAEALAQKTHAAQNTIGVAALGIGTAFAAVSVLAVSKFAEFDQAISHVGASTQASKGDLKLLSDAALDAGAKTSFSARDAANAEDELAKAGLSVKDILTGGLTGSLALAAAGTLDVATAGNIAATTLKQFNLDGSQTGHVADLLAAGAGKAQGSVQDLAEGLKYVGPVANGLGVSLEETVGTLALFATKGLLAEQGGTSLRGVIQSLVSPSKQASATMDEYGVSLFDANGKFIGVAGAAQQLQTAFGGLTDQERSQALGRIFGNEQITAANILMEAGAEGVNNMTSEVNSLGYATNVAAQKQDNLNSDIEKLGGSLDSALIKTGSGANDVLRQMVQIVTGLIDFYGQLPAPVQGAALMLGIGAAAVFLFGGAFLVAIPKIIAFREAVGTLTKTMPQTMGALKGFTSFLTGWWGIALAVAGVALSALNAQIQSGVPTQEKLTNALRTSASAADLLRAATTRSGTETAIWGDYADSLKDLPGLLDKVSNDGIADWLNLSFNQQGTVDSLKRVGETLAGVAESDLPAASKAFKGLSDQNHLNKEQQQKLLDAMPAYKDALTKQATALGLSADNTTLLKLAEEGIPPSIAKATAATEAQKKITEEAAKALADWLKMIGESDASFIDLAGAYNTIVQKNQDIAQATADATGSSKDSWKDYYDGITVSVDGYLADLQTQVDAQNNWEQNMLKLSGKVSQGTIDELARMGPEGAPLVAQLVNASGDELAKLDGVVAEKAGQATGTFANTLNVSGPVIAAAAAQLGQGAADEIAAKLAGGTYTVEQIMTEYKLKVEGFTPVVNVDTATAAEKINSLLNLFRTANAQQVSAPVGVGVLKRPEADGGNVKFFANGGENHIAQFARAGEARVWAEPETGGEWYLPDSPAKRARSVMIAQNMLARWGYQMIPNGGQSFGDGGQSGIQAPATPGLTWTGDIVIEGAGKDAPALSKMIRGEVNDLMRKARG